MATEDKCAIVISVPLFEGNQFLGCVAGTYNCDDFTKLVDISLFEGRGSYGVFNAEGRYIIRLQQSGMSTQFDTIYSFINSVEFTGANGREEIVETIKKR